MKNARKDSKRYDPVSVGLTVRDNWELVLSLFDDVREISEMIGYGFTGKDIVRLSEIHRKNPDLRKQVESLFADCNFDLEADALREGRYGDIKDRWLGKDERAAKEDWSDYKRAVWEMLEVEERDSNITMGRDF